MQALVEAAPRLDQHLGPESRAHFDELQAYLADAGIAYTINPRLVRGLDYYNLTVFEWITGQLGAQGTICGGGRYDGLIELFGGKAEPAVGFAIGLERLLELVKQTGALDAAVGCDVYVVHQSAEGRAAARLAFQVAEDLRTSGLDVILHCGGGSFKSQMKKADASGAEYAVIIGDDELAAGEVSVKPLRGEGAQQRVAVAQLAQRMVEIFPEELES